jgi:hypothetical protein
MKLNLSEQIFGFSIADSTGQRIFRKVFELFVVIGTCKLVWEWGMYTLRISDVILPLGLARYLDISFMHENTLPLWNAGLISILSVWGFLGKARWPYAIAFVLMLFQYAARFSLGEIPHSANLVGMGLLGYALGRLFYPEKLDGSRFAVGFSYLSVGTAYTFAAWSKLIGTGPFWFDGRHLWMWINEKAVDEISRSGFVELNFVQEIALSSQGVATMFLFFGMVTEFFAFLFCVRRLRFPVGMAILMLHIGIWLTMDIMFALSVWELVILAPPWAFVIDWYIGRRGESLTA